MFVGGEIPIFSEDTLQIGNRRTLQAQVRVAPVAEIRIPAQVFIADIEAAEERLQKFPKKDDVSFYLASANLLFKKGDSAAAGNISEIDSTVEFVFDRLRLVQANGK